MQINDLESLAKKYRREIFEKFLETQQGHPGSIFSMMEIMEPNDAVNLSTGKLTSFKEFASLASNLAGFSPEVSGTSSKPEGVFARGGDTTLQLEMKFKPKISFEDGIKRALNYFEKKI